MENKLIGLLVGSLRKEANSKKLAQNIIAMAPKGFSFRIIEISDLPFYNQDFDDFNQAPPAYSRFRNDIKALDGVLFITPEYNRSMPAVLKNALDVGSRPYNDNAWRNKPAGVLSNSIGAIGGFGANHHLRQCLSFIDMPTMQQPEAYIGNIKSGFFDDQGIIADQRTREFVQNFIVSYVSWYNRLQS